MTAVPAWLHLSPDTTVEGVVVVVPARCDHRRVPDEASRGGVVTAHAWTRDVRNGNPVMTCANAPCRVVWWPDRNQPNSECKGTPAEVTAAEFVRALMIGGAE